VTFSAPEVPSSGVQLSLKLDMSAFRENGHDHTGDHSLNQQGDGKVDEVTLNSRTSKIGCLPEIGGAHRVALWISDFELW